MLDNKAMLDNKEMRNKEIRIKIEINSWDMMSSMGEPSMTSTDRHLIREPHKQRMVALKMENVRRVLTQHITLL